MLAAKFHGVKDVRVEEARIPDIGSGDILLKTRAAAVCTSDLEAYRIGHRKLGVDYCPDAESKRTLGHEFAGEVVEVGAEVQGIRKGMRVAVAPNYGCGKCRSCHRGIYPVCGDRKLIGLDVDGGFAEYVRIPEEAVRQGVLCAYSENVPYEVAALSEPMAGVINGFTKCGLRPGESVLVIGGGPIGMMHLALAKATGARQTIVSELSKGRREAATGFGAGVLVDPASQDCAAAVRKATDGRGADVVIVACGSPEAQQTALELAAVHGRICFFGKLSQERQINGLNSNLIYSRELSIHGAYGSRPEHFAQARDLLEAGRINLLPLISHKFSIKEIPAAYETVLSDAVTGKGMKTIICFP